MLIWLSFSLSNWRFPCSLNGHISFPICWLLSLEWLTHFEHTAQSFVVTCLFIFVLGVTTNHNALKSKCPNKKSNRIRIVYRINTCTWSLTVGNDLVNKFMHAWQRSDKMFNTHQRAPCHTVIDLNLYMYHLKKIAFGTKVL